MCIVTYIPSDCGFSLTSNRDERFDRPTIAPRIYGAENAPLIYPLDLKGKGTWFSINPKEKKVCCLLNAEKQYPQGRQKQSRGHIPIAWISVSKFDFHKTPLDLYAPFGLITIENINRSIIIKKHNWNERKFKSEVLNPKKPYLWCSSSLYSKENEDEFENLFKEKIPRLKKTQRIIEFHKKIAQPLNSDRYKEKNKNIQTVSITHLKVKKSGAKMKYVDLSGDKHSIDGLSIHQ